VFLDWERSGAAFPETQTDKLQALSSTDLIRIGVNVLVARNYQPSNLVRLLPEPVRTLALPEEISRSEAWPGRSRGRQEAWAAVLPECGTAAGPAQWRDQATPQAKDLLYLFACQVEWERRADPSAAWEVISAARSPQADTRALARSLLERPQQIRPASPEGIPTDREDPENSTTEAGMRTPYGLEIIESCMGCKASREGFFCRFSPAVLRSVDEASHHTIMPAGAVLFVEGQTPRGVFVLCSGTVKLSTTSKEGKVLILKQAEAGEVLGLSAAISGTNYEMTAETAVPCQLNFIGRQDLMTLLQKESEAGVHAALWLSREFQGAYRDIHDLVLARSSSGKLARLLLSCAPPAVLESREQRLRSAMTHEEMAQRIGSSRETVTRLLSDLKKKRLIRLEGATLVIRDRTGLEALTL
jgi:CRP/FNR family cyclic AMP-dependent transcriptional regulator